MVYNQELNPSNFLLKLIHYYYYYHRINNYDPFLPKDYLPLHLLITMNNVQTIAELITLLI